MKALSYYFVYAACYLLSLLPMWVHYLLSDMLFIVLYRLIGYRRKIVWKNLTSAFPEKSEQELRDIERRFYHFLCDYFAESIKLMTISKKNLKRRLVFKGTELLNEVVESGQSCAIYLGHYGNWEWITSLPLWVTPKAQCGQIYHPLVNKTFDRLFLSLRQRLGSVCIPMHDTLRRILEYRRANKSVIIGYIADQTPYWTSIHHWLPFLNHPYTPVLTGAERIVRKMGHAAFYMDVQRVKRGYYTAEFKLITRQPDALPEFGLTEAYFKLLEESIRRDPAYWLWSHNRWKRTIERFNECFEIVNGKIVHRQPTAPADSASSAPYTAG